MARQKSRQPDNTSAREAEHPVLKDGSSGFGLPVGVVTFFSLIFTAGVFLIPFGVALPTAQSQVIYAGVMSISTFIAASLLSFLITMYAARASHRTELKRLGLIIARRLALLRSKINHLGDRVEEISKANPANQMADGWVVDELRQLAYDAHASTSDITITTNLDSKTVDHVFSQAEMRLKTDLEAFFCPSCGKRNFVQLAEGLGSTRHYSCDECKVLLMIHRNGIDSILVSVNAKLLSPIEEKLKVTAAIIQPASRATISVQCSGCRRVIPVKVAGGGPATIVRNCYDCFEQNEINTASGAIVSHSKVKPLALPLHDISKKTACLKCKAPMPGRPQPNKDGKLMWSCNNCSSLFTIDQA